MIPKLEWVAQIALFQYGNTDKKKILYLLDDKLKFISENQ